MRTFEVIDISGDAGIRAYGESLEALFVNAAMGMYSLITEPSSISERRCISVDVEGQSIDGLLVSWLNELIFHFDAYGFIGAKVLIAALTRTKITARVSGEEFDPERHEKRLLVKAATYHQLSIEKKEGFWTARVIFDI